MADSIHVVAGAGDVQGFTGPGTLYGYSVRETAGAVATVILRHGTQVTDPAVALIMLVANTSKTEMIAALDLPNGLFVDRVVGTTELVLYTA